MQLGYIYSKDFFSFLITLLTFGIFIQFGTSTITVLIWFKIITSLIGLIIHDKRKSKEIFFYMNIGVGKWGLIIYAVLVDLVLWISGFAVIIKLLL